jgi:hypothetical protein
VPHQLLGKRPEWSVRVPMVLSGRKNSGRDSLEMPPACYIGI